MKVNLDSYPQIYDDWIGSNMALLGMAAAFTEAERKQPQTYEVTIPEEQKYHGAEIVECRLDPMGISSHPTFESLEKGQLVKLGSKKFGHKETASDFDNIHTRRRLLTTKRPKVVVDTSCLDAEILETGKDKILLKINTPGVIFEECHIQVPGNNGEVSSQHFEYEDALRLEIFPKPGRLFLSGGFKQISPTETPFEKRNNLDDSQNAAYGRAMLFDECPVLFIQGGPGTGKTTTITNIIEGHVGKGRRVLVLSHSNQGAQVPALKLKRETKIPVHIAGNNPKVVMPALSKNRIKAGVNYPANAIARAIRGIYSGNSWQSAEGKQRDERNKLLSDYSNKIIKTSMKLGMQMKNGGVAFSTLGTLRKDEILKTIDFDVVIVDEATRLHYPDLLLALKHANKQIIFVGDPLQLGNIPSDEIKRAGAESVILNNVSFSGKRVAPEIRSVANMARQKIRRTAMESVDDGKDELDIFKAVRAEMEKWFSLYDEGPFSMSVILSENPEQDLPYVFLNQNRRSKPAIVKLVSELIYDGKLEAGRLGEGEGVVKFYDTSAIEAKERSAGTSHKNSKEAAVVVKAVLNKIFAEDVDPERIAIIATYQAQVETIKKLLAKKLFNHKDLLNILLENIGTVDSFQGDERDIVFISLTRSNEEGSVGFLQEERRIGVALGRARDELHVVGCRKTLTSYNMNDLNSKSPEFFKKMLAVIGEVGKIEKLQWQSPKKRRSKKKRVA